MPGKRSSRSGGGDGKHRNMAQADLRRVERCRQQLEDARAGLHQAIRDAVASGETYRDVAKLAGISHQRVAQIVKE